MQGNRIYPALLAALLLASAACARLEPETQTRSGPGDDSLGQSSQALMAAKKTALSRCTEGVECASGYCLEVGGVGYRGMARVCVAACAADVDCPSAWTCNSETERERSS